MTSNPEVEPGRRRWRAGAVVAGVFVTGYVSFSGFMLVLFDRMGRPDPQDFFEQREGFDAAAAWVAENGSHEDYRLDLPEQHKHLATAGYVSVYATTVTLRRSTSTEPPVGTSRTSTATGGRAQ